MHSTNVRRKARVLEGTKEEILQRIESSEALARSLRAGDAVVIVKTPAGIARRVLKRVRGISSSAGAGLTVSEIKALEGSGFSRAEPPLEKDPMISAEQKFSWLLESSLTTAQLAHQLGKDESRIRQRLTGEPRTLLGIRTGRGWLIPMYQFRRMKSGLEMIPGLDRVIPSIGHEVHPVTVYRWLTSPNPDLSINSSESSTPLQWLLAGGSPAVVANLAKEL